MKLFRRPLLFASTTLLRTVLFLGIPLMGLLLYFGNANYLEGTLQSSGAYTKLVPALAQTLAGSSGQGGIPFNDPGVVEIMNHGLPPQTIEVSTNQVIDGIYGWLQGKTAEPEFHVDLTKNRNFISENISLYAFNKLTKQPLCFTNPSQVDPFTSTCLPSNFDLNAQRTTFATAINQVFPKTVFTADDLPRMSGGKTISQTFPQLPQYYRLLLWTPWLFGILLIGLCVAVVRLCRNQRLGFRLLGRVTLSTGVALMITPILYLLLYPRINSALHLQSANSGLNALTSNVVSALNSSFYLFLIKAALIIVNVGLAMVLLEHYTRGKNFAAIGIHSGVVSSNPRRGKRTKSSKPLTAATIPIQSSDARSGAGRGKLFEKFRKLTSKEWS